MPMSRLRTTLCQIFLCTLLPPLYDRSLHIEVDLWLPWLSLCFDVSSSFLFICLLDPCGGDLDLLVGFEDGSMRYYENTANNVTAPSSSGYYALKSTDLFTSKDKIGYAYASPWYEYWEGRE